MPKFSKHSLQKLNTCNRDLQKVFNEVIKYYDCTILCGHRNEIDQNESYYSGRSKLKYPHSKHNKYPSLAVDVAPYFSHKPHIRWNDTKKFYEFAGFVQGVASMLDIDVVWGGNWNDNDELYDQTFFDLPHFQLKG